MFSVCYSINGFMKDTIFEYVFTNTNLKGIIHGFSKTH